MKECFKCKEIKRLDSFYRHKEMKDGRLNKCKQCATEDARGNYASKKASYRRYDTERQRLSIARIYSHRYLGIVQRSKGKATRGYKVEGMPYLSREQFDEWCKCTREQFNNLYIGWASSGFIRKLTPSIDRIDSSRPYIASNMQWLTLSENCRKYTK